MEADDLDAVKAMLLKAVHEENLAAFLCMDFDKLAATVLEWSERRERQGRFDAAEKLAADYGSVRVRLDLYNLDAVEALEYRCDELNKLHPEFDWWPHTDGNGLLTIRVSELAEAPAETVGGDDQPIRLSPEFLADADADFERMYGHRPVRHVETAPKP